MSGQQLDLFDLEALASEVRCRAKLAEGERVPAETVARRILGRGALRRVPGFSTTGVLLPVDGGYRIFVRRNVPDENFVIAHELGHWALRTVGYVGPDEETFANRIGAGIIAPASLTQHAHAHYGENILAIARALDVTESFVVLRLAEVLGDERALVSREVVRIRSAGAFDWPEPDEVRRWKEGRPPPGVRRATLRAPYDRGRVAFRAA